jgi:hypothetical protein
LTPEQQQVAIAAIRSGLPIEKVSQAIGVPERLIWKALPWDKLDKPLQRAVITSLDKVAEQLAEVLSRRRDVPGGHEQTKAKEGRRRKRKRRIAKRSTPAAVQAATPPDAQADEEPFVSVLARAKARREIEERERAAVPTPSRPESEEKLDGLVAAAEQELPASLQDVAHATNGVYEPG